MTFKAIALVAAVLLCAAPAAPASTPETVFLEELTWTEVRDRLGGGHTTILVPTGGTEQNGPHMALGKHNARVRALAEQIARTLGHTLVAPVLAYVPEGAVTAPGGHLRYPGTITLPPGPFEHVLEYAARSLKLHGFRDIVLVGDHGASQDGQRAVAARLNREWAASAVRVHAIAEYYRASTVTVRDLFRTRGYRDEELGTHAGLTDTSLMLAIDPRLVRMERLRRGTGVRDGDGVDGDPSRSTAELGRLGVDAIVTRTVDAIRQSIARR
jgi:creatinine amidohydrolase